MNTHKIVFLFPGQGSQSVGMGRNLFDRYPVARRAFEEADDALGLALSDLCFNGPEDQLKLTEFTQPAIFTVSIAAQRVLAEKGVTPSYVAGHSLGEYSANVAAGVLSFADAVRTVRSRGRFMQQAVPAGQGAMAAVLGMSSEEAARACTDAAAETGGVVSPANFNSPEQTVISGDAAPVERAAALCRDRGAKKVVMLAVSAPFHCALMQPAQDRLAELLNALAFAPPSRARRRECRRRPPQRCRSAPRRPYPPGNGGRTLGRVHAPPDRAAANSIYRNRSGQSALRPHAPDRPQPNLPERRRRGKSGEDISPRSLRSHKLRMVEVAGVLWSQVQFDR